jgi:DNA modification methylase
MTFYERDCIVIHHGDSLAIIPTFPPCSVDFILTDPLYLVNYRGRWDGDKKLSHYRSSDALVANQGSC